MFFSLLNTGSTPVIVYVETAAGIEEGGRTGLTAVVISLMFFASVFLAPLFSQIPAVATAPVSMFIGTLFSNWIHNNFTGYYYNAYPSS